MFLSGRSRISPTAIPNQFYKLQCIVFGAINLADIIIFSRKTATSIFAAATQKGDKCFVRRWPPSNSYRLLCGNGTDQHIDITKVYVLLINLIAKDDLTDWTCRLNTQGTTSNVFTIRTQS